MAPLTDDPPATPPAGRPAPALFDGPGEMRERCRALDWAATPLGPTKQWSPTLRAVVRACLESPFPVNLWCGPARVLVYNDAYIRALGAKHPAALGRPGAEVWAEIWPEIAPMFAQIDAGGPPVFAEDAPFVMEREGDAPGEHAWFTFGLSAVRDEAGAIVAYFNPASETTARVEAERALTAARSAAEHSEARLREVFRQAPSFFCVLRGPAHVFEFANDAYYQLVGKGPEILGRPLRDALPEVRGQGFEELLDRVLATGKPYRGREVLVRLAHTPGAEPEERFVDFVYQALVEADGTRSGVIAHGTDVTDSVRARRAVEAARDRAARLQVLTAALAAATTPEVVAAVVVAQGVDATGAATGALVLRAPDDPDELVMLQQTGLVTDVAAEFARFPLAGVGPSAACVRTGEPFFLTSPDAVRARFPEIPDVWERLGTRALVTVPLAVTGATGAPEVIGAMSFTFTAARDFAPEDRDFYLALGRQCALTLERARLVAAERTAAASARLLQQVTAAFSGVLTHEAAVRVLVKRGVAALGAATGLVMLRSADGQALEMAGAHGYPPNLLDRFRRMEPEAGFAVAAAYRAGAPVWVEDPEAGVAAYPELAALYAAGGYKATAALPLVDGAGGVFGALAFNFAAPQRFGPERRALLEALARQCGQALERARLFAAEHAARAEAERARHAAEEANRAKSAFLATMSHELRTPLNAILGYTQLLELGVTGSVTEAQLAQLGRIRASGGHLVSLVNEVLDLAKLEAGHLAVERAPHDVGDAAEAALALVRPQAAAKGLTLELACQDAGPGRALRYLGDAQRVRQVLVNLLANAVKFTPAGGRVLVRAAAAEGGPGGRPGAWVALGVEDTGVGIAADQLDAIFRPFVQAEAGRSAYTREHGGAGLGLAISRQLAELMGGALTVESRPGAGSRFTLWLPVAAEAAPGAAPNAPNVRDAPNVATGDAPAGREGREPAPAPGGADAAGFAALGRALLDAADAVLAAFVARLRAEPLVPDAGALDDVRLANHTRTLLADVAQALTLLGAGNDDGEVSALLRDGAEIQRLVAERHGAQRYRLGWPAAALRREFVVLHDEIARLVGAARGVAPAAHAALARLLGQAAETSVRSFEQEAATDGRRPPAAAAEVGAGAGR